MKKEVKDFLHKIDVNALRTELNKDVADIAKLADITENGVFKWSWEKSKNGTRPSYNAIIKLLRAGASVETLFGVDYNSVKKNPARHELNYDSPEFKRGVARAIDDLKKMGFIK